MFQDDSNPAWIANRAHGNTVEYVPTAIGLMLWITLHAPYPVWLDGVMALFTVSRLLFVYGLLGYPTMKVPNKPRFLGAVGTYVFGVVLAGAAAYVAIKK